MTARAPAMRTLAVACHWPRNRPTIPDPASGLACRLDRGRTRLGRARRAARQRERERESARARERERERARERESERARERESKRAREQESERARERESERASERERARERERTRADAPHPVGASTRVLFAVCRDSFRGTSRADIADAYVEDVSRSCVVPALHASKNPKP
jgi:hypothetical protein